MKHLTWFLHKTWMAALFVILAGTRTPAQSAVAVPPTEDEQGAEALAFGPASLATVGFGLVGLLGWLDRSNRKDF